MDEAGALRLPLPAAMEPGDDALGPDGEVRKRRELLLALNAMQYQRVDVEFVRGKYRVRGDALDLPFADASFDVVCCQFGAMFFPDRVAGYAEAREFASAHGPRVPHLTPPPGSAGEPPARGPAPES